MRLLILLLSFISSQRLTVTEEHKQRSTYKDKVGSGEVVCLVLQVERVEPFKHGVVHAIVQICFAANG